MNKNEMTPTEYRDKYMELLREGQYWQAKELGGMDREAIGEIGHKRLFKMQFEDSVAAMMRFLEDLRETHENLPGEVLSAMLVSAIVDLEEVDALMSGDAETLQNYVSATVGVVQGMIHMATARIKTANTDAEGDDDDCAK